MASQFIKDFLSEALNDKDPDDPELDGWRYFWRIVPPEPSNPNNPLGFSRPQLLPGFIKFADTEPWARTALRALLQHLSETSEHIPVDLCQWTLNQFARGKPAPKRGRPRNIPRDIYVTAAYLRLQVEGYTYEEAAGFIADYMPRDNTDTVQSITRNLLLFTKLKRESFPIYLYSYLAGQEGMS